MKSPGRHLYNLTNWPLTQLAKSAVWPNSPDELPSKENNDDKMLINDVFQFFKNFHAPGPAPPVPRPRSRAPGPVLPVPCVTTCGISADIRFASITASRYRVDK